MNKKLFTFLHERILKDGSSELADTFYLKDKHLFLLLWGLLFLHYYVPKSKVSWYTVFLNSIRTKDSLTFINMLFPMFHSHYVIPEYSFRFTYALINLFAHYSFSHPITNFWIQFLSSWKAPFCFLFQWGPVSSVLPLSLWKYYLILTFELYISWVWNRSWQLPLLLWRWSSCQLTSVSDEKSTATLSVFSLWVILFFWLLSISRHYHLSFAMSPWCI